MNFNYEILHPVLVRYAERVGHPDPEAFAQDVFVRALENPYENRGYKVSTYIHTIARNLMRDFYKRKRFELIESTDEIRSSIVRSWFEYEDIHQAIKTLPENWKIVIFMIFYEDLSIDQIGEILGISQREVNILRHRALIHLLNELQNKDI